MERNKMDERSDMDLLRAYAEGESSAFEVLYNRHQQRLYNYVFSMVKDKTLTGDIVQETFIKADQTLRAGVYRDEGKFIQWVMRIAHNIVIDYFRKNQKLRLVYSTEENDIFDLVDSVDESAETTIIRKQIHSDVRKLIKKLPDEQRRVLVMRHYADMSFKEIAEKTGVSINTALGRMRYALINIRKLADENSIVLTM
ncbi:MAG: RNA polymerase sigma factor [Candidatus Onthomorpha sp.]